MKFIRKKTLESIVGMSTTSIWRAEKAGQFPLRRKIGKASVAWVLEEIEEWMRKRPTVGNNVSATVKRS